MGKKPQKYKEYVAKFKRKPTSDDTFTPPNVYEAVKGWAVREYRLEGRPVVRPFWPDGDYEKFDYPKGCVVIDNPPFSILAKILRFYNDRAISFFLFCHGLTPFGIIRDKRSTLIPASYTIRYANGAKINTSFVTNLDPDLLIADGSGLNQILRSIFITHKQIRRSARMSQLPDYIISPSTLSRFSRSGIKFCVKKSDAEYLHTLGDGKEFFRHSFILSDRAAADRAAAERAAAERAAAERYELSERELELVKKLSTPK